MIWIICLLNYIAEERNEVVERDTGKSGMGTQEEDREEEEESTDFYKVGRKQGAGAN